MLTGQFVNQDGGVHSAAVAVVTKLEVDVVKRVNVATVEVYHDAAAAAVPANPQRQVRPIATKTYTLKAADFSTSLADIEGFVARQPAFLDWHTVA